MNEPYQLQDIVNVNIITSALLKMFPSLQFKLLIHTIKNGSFEFEDKNNLLIWKDESHSTCYRAVCFNSTDGDKNLTIYAESYLNLIRENDYIIANELETSNESLGSFLLMRWNERELEFTTICIEKILGKNVPEIFGANEEDHFLLRRRVIRVEGYQFVIYEYLLIIP